MPIGASSYSPELAVRLRGRDPQGQTWEYLYAIDDLRDIDVPYAAFHQAVGYADNTVPQGFNVVTDGQSDGVFRLPPWSASLMQAS